MSQWYSHLMRREERHVSMSFNEEGGTSCLNGIVI